jgi:hypothetical protein
MADFQNMADFPARPPPAAARDDCSWSLIMISTRANNARVCYTRVLHACFLWIFSSCSFLFSFVLIHSKYLNHFIGFYSCLYWHAPQTFLNVCAFLYKPTWKIRHKFAVGPMASFSSIMSQSPFVLLHESEARRPRKLSWGNYWKGVRQLSEHWIKQYNTLSQFKLFQQAFIMHFRFIYESMWHIIIFIS